MKKILIYLLMLCFLVPLIQAQPFLQQSQTGTIDIRIGGFETFNINSNFTFHIHAFNSSGYALTNDTTTCFLHIYNKTGNHVIQSEMDWDNNNMEWKYEIDHATNFTYHGGYSGIVWCNNSIQGGFISTTVTGTNNGNPTDNFQVIGMIIAFALIAGLLIILHQITGKEHWLLKFIIMMFVPLLFVLMGNYTHTLSLGTGLSTMGETVNKIILWFVRLFYVYVITALAYTIFNKFTVKGMRIRKK